MTNENNTLPAPDQAFLNILTNHRNGMLITDVSKAIRQVAAACQLTGESGKVTLTMKLRPATVGDAATLVFEPVLKTTVPEVKQPGSIFYADDDYNLVREDPRQQRLALKVVESVPPTPAAELKTVN